MLRTDGPVPVRGLTAKGDATDMLVGLTLAADHYITKPFSPRELVARGKAVLRRSALARACDGDTLRLQDLSINPKTRQGEVRGRGLDLTAREFDLLWFLAKHSGQVFTREQLLYFTPL